MTFQAIRAAYEDHIRTAAAALTPPVPVFFENQPFTDADAAKEHILMRLDFGVIGEETIGDMVENVRGSLVVEVYTPKGRGPGRSQVVAAALAKALSAMNAQRRKAATGVRASIHPITGPSFAALEGKPHFFSRVGCGFQASYTVP